MRAPDAERLDALVAAIGVEPSYRVEPVRFEGEARSALAEAIEARSLQPVDLPSGAGHDAGILASGRASTPRCSSSAA